MKIKAYKGDGYYLDIKIRNIGYIFRILPKDIRRFWWSYWIPKWHNGRGHYISLGLYFIAFYRGY